MRSSLTLIIAIASLVVWMPACRQAAQEPAPSAVPARIVSLTPALTEILFAVGAGDRVVGVTEYCDFPPEARTRPKVGGYVNPSVEAVVALKPDLIVVSPGPGNRDAALAMQRQGLRVEVVPAESLEDTLAAIVSVARMCGDEGKGTALVGSIRARFDAVSRRVARLPRVPTLFSVQTTPIIAAGSGTLPAQILEIAGGRNVVTEPRYPRIGLESVLSWKPELILQSRMDAPAQPSSEDAELAFWSRWKGIPAVSANRVVLLDPGVGLRPGPRVADDAEALAAIIHPLAGR